MYHIYFSNPSEVNAKLSLGLATAWMVLSLFTTSLDTKLSK